MRGFTFFWGLLALLLMIQAVVALRIDGNPVHILYENGSQTTYSFHISGAEHIEPYVREDALHAVTIIDPLPQGGDRNVQVVVNVTGAPAPGVYKAFFGAREIGPDNSFIGGVIAIEIPIVVEIPPPSPSPVLAITLPDIHQGEQISGNLHIANRGAMTMENLVVTAAFAKRTSVVPAPTSIGPLQEQDIPLAFDTALLEPGAYIFLVEVSYEGGNTTIEKALFIYGEGMRILNATTTLDYAPIVPFTVAVENIAEHPVTSFALYTLGTSSGRTNLLSVPSQKKAVLSGYLELGNMTPGTYPLIIAVVSGGTNETKVFSALIENPATSNGQNFPVAMVVLFGAALLVAGGYFVRKKRFLR